MSKDGMETLMLISRGSLTPPSLHCLPPTIVGMGRNPGKWGSVASELSTLTTSDYREEEEVWRKEMERGKKTFVFIYTFPVQNKKVPPSAKEVSSSKIAAKEGKLEYA